MADPQGENPADDATGKPKSRAGQELGGTQLGDFQLLRRLGRGGMAEVWLAEQTSLKRQVAIKILKRELADDETYIQRFQNEARAAARLVHANIVQIHEVGCVDGVHYIAQEYVAGQNLREYMVKHGPPDTKTALSIIRQVAAALLKASEDGVVHRDVKPENIMLSGNGEVKVADFGLARLLGDGALNLTQVGMTMGTPLYMSPEQVEGKSLDHRSDVYSLGVTCYHMLSGSPPFRGDSALSVAVQHLKSRPEPLEQSRPDLPSGLCRVIHKMLAKEPAQRYASCREVLRDLRKIRAEEAPSLGSADSWDDLDSLDIDLTVSERSSSAAHRLAGVMQTETMEIPRMRRAPWVYWTVVVALGFCAGAAGAYLVRDEPLLADAESPAVRKMNDAKEQYFLAAYLDNESGWRSVIDYFPNEQNYVRRARQQLARLDLYRRRDYESALKRYDEFANLPGADFKAFGLAGKFMSLVALKRHEDAGRTLGELVPLISNREEAARYLDAQTQRELREVIQHHNKRIGQEASEAHQGLLKALEEDLTDESL
ncbi:MAG: serine/threonine protein kinase [Planctomycetales bacterium]